MAEQGSLTLYLIVIPLDTFANRADPAADPDQAALWLELPDQGIL